MSDNNETKVVTNPKNEDLAMTAIGYLMADQNTLYTRCNNLDSDMERLFRINRGFARAGVMGSIAGLCMLGIIFIQDRQIKRLEKDSVKATCDLIDLKMEIARIEENIKKLELSAKEVK